MNIDQAGKVVSNFWTSYMIGMWVFSFVLRFFDLQRIVTVLAALATGAMYLFISTDNPEYLSYYIMALGFVSSAIYTTLITLGSQQTKVSSPKLVNFILTCGTIGTMLTFVVTGRNRCQQRSPCRADYGQRPVSGRVCDVSAARFCDQAPQPWAYHALTAASFPHEGSANAEPFFMSNA